jgi:tetratricopeptide (TPR) repeat protein
MRIQSTHVKAAITGTLLIAGTYSMSALAYINQIDPTLDTLSHQQLFELQETSQLAEDIWGRLTSEFIRQYESADYAQALVTAKVAYDLAENSFGPNDVNTADSMLKLGIVSEALGNTTLAKEHLLGALVILEDTLGPNHVDVAVVLTNLANVFFEENNVEESERYHTKALKIRQQNLGPKDPAVAQSMYNLAVLYDDVKDYDRAAVLYENSLEIWYETLGADHPYVANALNNLGNVYVVKGEFDLAAQLHQHSLSIRRNIYGDEHPEVARSLINLASLYVKESDYNHAEPLYREAVKLSEKLFGPSHPQVAMLLYSLANVYHIQGRMDLDNSAQNEKVAAVIYDTAVATGDVKKVAYVPSRKTAQAYFNRALPLYERALAIFDNSIGSDHPAITAMLNELAMLYKSIGEFKLAEQMMARMGQAH